MDRTDSKIDTPVARGSSWIVRDPDGNAWGPFETAEAASNWARTKWPEIPQVDEANGSGRYWDVEALRAPS